MWRVRVCVCGVCVCVHICAHDLILSSCHPVQVAPKVSTSHYTMAVIMYMRVGEEGGKGKGGERGVGIGGEGWVVRGEGMRGRTKDEEECVAAHY